ncbi:MAG: hypothetical protein JO142_02670 [Burkholderiales bacterium]|nr:hypothetical protein [Burkholderiales bacterium]
MTRHILAPLLITTAGAGVWLPGKLAKNIAFSVTLIIALAAFAGYLD